MRLFETFRHGARPEVVGRGCCAATTPPAFSARTGAAARFVPRLNGAGTPQRGVRYLLQSETPATGRTEFCPTCAWPQAAFGGQFVPPEWPISSLCLRTRRLARSREESRNWKSAAGGRSVRHIHAKIVARASFALLRGLAASRANPTAWFRSRRSRPTLRVSGKSGSA